MGLSFNAMPFLGDLPSNPDLGRLPHLYLHLKPHYSHFIYSIYSYHVLIYLIHWAINARARIKLAWVTLVPTMMGTTWHTIGN